MVRSFLKLCLWCLTATLACSASGAHAQVRRGDVRLYLDSQFVSWDSERTRIEDRSGRETLTKLNTTSVGLLNQGGIGLAYAVSQHVLPGLYFSLHHRKARGEVVSGSANASSGETVQRVWELRPQLEIPFNPGSRFVLHATGGVSLMRGLSERPDRERFGVGPVVGLGAHGFVGSRCSLDLGLMFRASFIRDDDLERALEAAGQDARFRNLAVLFNLGVSFWL